MDICIDLGGQSDLASCATTRCASGGGAESSSSTPMSYAWNAGCGRVSWPVRRAGRSSRRGGTASREPGSSARTPWPRNCPSGPGRSCPPEPEPKGIALRLGPHRTAEHCVRPPSPADPPQPNHRRTHLLPLLLTRIGTPDNLGAGCGIQMESGRGVPIRKGPGRPGRAPASPLLVLAPLGHPGHARPCLPGRRPSRRAPSPSGTRRPATKSSASSSPSSPGPSTKPVTGFAGPTGGVVIRPSPRPGTTGAKPRPKHDRDPQLKY